MLTQIFPVFFCLYFLLNQGACSPQPVNALLKNATAENPPLIISNTLDTNVTNLEYKQTYENDTSEVQDLLRNSQHVTELPPLNFPQENESNNATVQDTSKNSTLFEKIEKSETKVESNTTNEKQTTINVSVQNNISTELPKQTLTSVKDENDNGESEDLLHGGSFSTISTQSVVTNKVTVEEPSPVNIPVDENQVELIEDTQSTEIITSQVHVVYADKDTAYIQGETAVTIACVFAVFAIVAYITLIVWRRWLEKRYGNRELLYEEDDDMRHFSI